MPKIWHRPTLNYMVGVRWENAPNFFTWCEVDRSALSPEQFRLSVFCCCGPVDLKFATQHWVWKHTFLRHIDEMYSAHWTFFDNALYKFTLYLLTYFLDFEMYSERIVRSSMR